MEGLPDEVKTAVRTRLAADPIPDHTARSLGFDLLEYIDLKDIGRCLDVIGQGADLMVVDRDGRTSLTSACYKNLPKVALAIIYCPGVDINVKVRTLELTPLMMAIINGLGSVVVALLRNRADVNAMDREGRTALYYACANSRPQTALALIRAGADVHTGNLLEMPQVNTPSMKEVKEALRNALDAPTRTFTEPSRETAGGRRRKTRKARKHRKNHKHSHKKN